MVKMITVVAVLVLLAGCTGQTAKPAVPVQPGSSGFVTTLPETAPPTEESSSSSQPSVVAAGQSAPAVLTDGTPLDITVGNPLGTAALNGLWTGLPVTISATDLSLVTINAGQFTFGPIADSSNNDVADGEVAQSLVGIDNVTPIACRGMPYLADAITAAATAGKQTARGCVVFLYETSDRPTIVSFVPDNSDPSVAPEAEWTVKPSVPKAAPSGIVYAVTSASGISDVTYTTAGNGQSQDTDVNGSSWRKEVPDDRIPYAVLLAQNAGGGTITCTITVDGQQIAKESSNGQYATVTCSASTTG